MRIRGNRRCENCGREWSYFDTGRVACPACGSLRSVGTGDRERHTDSAVELDLSEYRLALDDGPSDDAVQLYLLELLGGADAGDRPAPESVPESMTDARGLAYAEVLDRFCTDLGTWLDDHPNPAAGRVRETLDTHVRRVQAVYGDVPPGEVETLVRAAREIVKSLTTDGETTLATARERLSGLQ